MEDVAERMFAMYRGRDEKPMPSMGNVVHAAARLSSVRLILADLPVKRLAMRLSLNIPQDDLVYQLNHDESIKWLAEIAF